MKLTIYNIPLHSHIKRLNSLMTVFIYILQFKFIISQKQ